MNLNHLKYCYAVITHGSFTKAAQASNVTQPTLSNGIRQLEDQLGGKLFERTTRSVRLTAFGRHMVPGIRSMVEADDELRQCAKLFAKPNHKIAGVGFSPLADTRLLSAVLNPFKDRHPDIRLFFKECFMEPLHERLDQSQLAVGIRPHVKDFWPDHQVSVRPLYHELLHVVPSEGTSTTVSGSGPCYIDDLEGEIFVLTPDICGHAPATRALFAQRGKTLREYAGQAVSYQAMQEWAGLGIASAILPWSKINADNRMRARPLFIGEDRPAELKFELIWKEEARSQPHIGNLIDHLAENARKIVSGLSIQGEEFHA